MSLVSQNVDRDMSVFSLSLHHKMSVSQISHSLHIMRLLPDLYYGRHV